MTRNEIIAYNAGVADLTAIAEAAADVLRARITDAPTRFNFAISALEGIVEAAGDLSIQDADLRSPAEPGSGANGTEEAADAC